MKRFKIVFLFWLLAVGCLGTALATSTNKVTTETKTFEENVPFAATIVNSRETGRVVSALFIYTVSGQVVAAPKETIDALNEEPKNGIEKADSTIQTAPADIIIEHVRDLPGGGAVYNVMRTNGRVIGLLIVDSRGYVQYIAL